MAGVNMESCLDCGKAISGADKYCPSCGRDIRLNGMSTGKKNLGRDLIIIAGGLLVVVAGYFIWGEKPVEKSTGFTHPEVSGTNMGNMPDMDKIVAELPNDFRELVNLGNNYMDHGIYAMAIECYQKAVNINDNDPNLLVDLGTCRYSIGENEKAIEMFEKALTINPDHVIAHFNLGVVYRALGNKEKAIQYWSRVPVLQPGSLLADTANYYIANFKME